jgi:hypothetical protein
VPSGTAWTAWPWELLAIYTVAFAVTAYQRVEAERYG